MILDYYEHIKSDEEFTRIVADFKDRQEKRDQLSKNEVKFNDWIVKMDGTMVNSSQHDYTIDGGALEEDGWISHMKGKSGIDMNTFLDAYFFALTFRKGVKKLTIKIY